MHACSMSTWQAYGPQYPYGMPIYSNPNLQFQTLDPRNHKYWQQTNHASPCFSLIYNFKHWTHKIVRNIFQTDNRHIAQALSNLVYNFKHWTSEIVMNTYQVDCTSLNCACLWFQASNPQNCKEKQQTNRVGSNLQFLASNPKNCNKQK